MNGQRKKRCERENPPRGPGRGKAPGRRRIIPLSWLLFSLLFVLQNALLGNFPASIKKILSNPVLEKAKVGIHVYSLSKEKEIYKKNSRLPLIPASNVKLITGGAALCLLGDEYRFQTILGYGGRVSEGVLKGDLIVIGRGDPNLSGRFHDEDVLAVPKLFAEKVHAAGIRSVEGKILLDDSFFDREFIHPSWPRKELHKWYCAEISALSFNDNCLDLIIRKGSKPGQPVQVEIVPPTNYVQVENRCTTTESNRHIIILDRIYGTNRIRINGSFRMRGNPFEGTVTIHHPSLYFGEVFKEVLERRGIPVSGGLEMADRPLKTTEMGHLFTASSPLVETIEVALKRSQNFYSEQILKTMGREIEGEGSFEKGVSAAGRFLAMAGIERGTYTLKDGSGLSRENRFTAEQITKILRYMYSSAHRSRFLSSLPLSGTDGTLKDRMKSSPLKGKVRAKTGSLSGVSCLSGYLLNAEKELLCFSLLFNDYKAYNYQVKRIQDRVCEVLFHGEE